MRTLSDLTVDLTRNVGENPKGTFTGKDPKPFQVTYSLPFGTLGSFNRIQFYANNFVYRVDFDIVGSSDDIVDSVSWQARKLRKFL